MPGPTLWVHHSLKCCALTKWPILHAILSHICVSQRSCIWTFEVCKNVHLHIWDMCNQFWTLIPMLRGSFGLPSVDGDLLTKHPIYLVLLHASTMVCNFQHKCIWNVKSIHIVTIHLWKMPLKYWGVVPTLG